MPAFYYPKLLVYQLAMDVAIKVDELAIRLPTNYWHVANQVRRAALSIALNIAEGSSSYSKKIRLQRYGTANGSAAECNSIFEFIVRRGLLPAEDLPIAEVNRIGALLYGSLRKK